MEKFVFHIPNFCIIGGSISACDTSDFKRELVDAFTKAGDNYFYIVPAKGFLRGIEFPFEMLVLYDTKDTECLYTDIFIELVCKCHSELKQEQYYYERGSVLVNLKIGGCGDYEGC